MAFVPAPNIAMVEWRCTRFAQQIENRIHVNLGGAPAAGDLMDLAIAMWNWWELDHSLGLASSVGLREVVVTYLGIAEGEQVTYAPDATTTGALGGIELPNEVSFCVSLRTGNRGRSARGRWYVLSLTNDLMLDPNNLNPTAVALFVADLNALRVIIEGLGYFHAIVSYRTGNAPRPGGPVYFIVTNASAVDSTVDSMKRRKPGVGS